jgi:putative SOS response-associated peptidase YedK
MCGRFALTLDAAELQDAFPGFSFPDQTVPRFNIAPSQPILAIPNDGTKKADFFRWGLVPAWSKDPSISSHLINARAETVSEKPSFRSAFKHHRCLIPATGFYEWRIQPGSKVKVPYFIHLKDSTSFAFAGLWEHWVSADGSELRTAVIITTTPNALMRIIHDRMPVILPKHTYTNWLDSQIDGTKDLLEMLAPYPAEEMETFPVSTIVNSPDNDRAECILPA